MAVRSSRGSSLRRGVVLVAALAAAAATAVHARYVDAQRPAAAGVAAAFQVRMHRPAAVGRRGRITVQGEKHSSLRITMGGRVVRNSQQDLTVQFRAIERVLSVTPNGKPLVSEFTIEQFESTDPQGHHVLLPAAQVVTLTRGARGADATVTVAGTPAPAAVREALEVVVGFTTSGATDDEIFGSNQRQAIGATWPLHADVAQRDFAANAGMQAGLSGQTHLNARTNFQGVDCLDVSAELLGTVTALPDLPPGSVVRTGTMRAMFRGMFPVAINLPALQGSTSLTMELVVDVPGESGGTGQIQSSMREAKTETFQPL